MRTRNPQPTRRTTARRTASAKAVAFGAGVLLATTGFASAAAAAAPQGPGNIVVTPATPTTRATTTTTRRITNPTRDICRLVPDRCHPPKPPCVIDPPKEPEAPVLRNQTGPADLTVRTLTTLRPRPTTTKPEHCPPPPTKPEPKQPKVPPVRVTPKFTG